jgi:glutathione peroxidase
VLSVNWSRIALDGTHMKAFPYTTSIKGLDGNPLDLTKYQDSVLLIINTASLCGFTPQYAGLQALWERYKDRGLVVLGVPCDQFGNQEPGAPEEIRAFCDGRYQVTFPLTEKVEVNGSNAHPLFVFLKEASPGVLGTEAIKWNFTKFLIGRQGTTVQRFAPSTSPESLAPHIEELLVTTQH